MRLIGWVITFCTLEAISIFGIAESLAQKRKIKKTGNWGRDNFKLLREVASHSFFSVFIISFDLGFSLYFFLTMGCCTSKENPSSETENSETHKHHHTRSLSGLLFFSF